MESKLNFTAIESYAKTYSSKICDDLFSNKSTISGNDLLELPVEQAGLFVIDHIYTSWQREAEKVKSPFFDYESADVKTALKKLMNVLSQNIAVDREHLEPILTESVKDVILLVISPYTYFKNLISSLNNNSEFSEHSRFIKINGVLAKAIETAAERNGVDNLSESYDQIFNDIEFTPDDPKEILAKFSETMPVAESNFFLTLEDETEEEEETATQVADNTINDKFVGSNYETVADTLKSNHSSKGSIKSMLSINQKFMFINDLFNDNQDDFNKVVDFIEGCDTKEAALSFISNNYLKHNIWNPNAPQVREFLRLIDLQFE